MSNSTVAVFLAATVSACFPQAGPPQQSTGGMPGWYRIGQAEVVPASAAPPPPSGHGWYCFDLANVNDRSAHSTSRCERAEGDCTRIANNHRTQSRQQVGFCQPQPSAVCTATFTNPSDARYTCSKRRDHCGPIGGPSPIPGVKHSECTEVE
jgi:hypothetical protein